MDNDVSSGAQGGRSENQVQRQLQEIEQLQSIPNTRPDSTATGSSLPRGMPRGLRQGSSSGEHSPVQHQSKPDLNSSGSAEEPATDTLSVNDRPHEVVPPGRRQFTRTRTRFTVDRSVSPKSGSPKLRNRYRKKKDDNEVQEACDSDSDVDLTSSAAASPVRKVGVHVFAPLESHMTQNMSKNMTSLMVEASHCPTQVARRKHTFRNGQLNRFHAPIKQAMGKTLQNPLRLFANAMHEDAQRRHSCDESHVTEHHGVQGGWLMKGRLFRSCLSGLVAMSRLSVNKTAGNDDTKILSKQAINFLVFCNLLITIFFAVFDVTTAIIFALAWPHDRYLCQEVSMTKQQYRRNAAAQWHTDPDVHGFNFLVLSILLVVPIVDTWKLVLRYRTRMPDGSMVGFRYWTTSNIGDGISLESRLTETFWLFVSVISLALSVGLCYPENGLSYERMIHELHKVSHFLRALQSLHKCYTLRKKAKKYLQVAVSQNKRRFVSPIHSIDIDLSYICDRLIAMSIPCHASVMHRNEIKEVCRFFRTWHYGHFKVYNLCEAHEENGSGNYDVGIFYNQVQKVPMKDKHSPPLHILVHLCEDASAWLNEDPLNVLAVHCKGGTGRTGLVCTSLMIFTRRFRTAEESLRYFHNRRVSEAAGSSRQAVRSPSQRRYVSYVEAIVNKGVDFLGGTPKLIGHVAIDNVPDWLQEGQTLNFQIENKNTIVFDYAKHMGVVESRRMTGSRWAFEFDPVPVQGDVTIRMFMCANGLRKTKRPEAEQDELCFLQFHTAFCSLSEDTVYTRDDVDGIHELSHEQIPEDFRMVVRVREVEEDPADIYRLMLTRYSPTRHFIWLAAMMPELAKKVSSETIVFEEGAIMFSPDVRPTQRKLFYVVSGTAKRYTIGVDPSRSVISNTELFGYCLGAGEFFGIQSFLLGHGMDARGYVLRAWSKRVVVRVFTIPGPVDDVIQQVLFDGCDAQESAAVWETLARQLNSQRRAEDAVKAYGGMLVTVSPQQKVFGERLMRRVLGKDKTEEVLYAGTGALAWAMESGGVQDDDIEQGSLVITAEKVIFVVEEDDVIVEELQLPVEHLQKVGVREGWLSLTIKDEFFALQDLSPAVSAAGAAAKAESPVFRGKSHERSAVHSPLIGARSSAVASTESMPRLHGSAVANDGLPRAQSAGKRGSAGRTGSTIKAAFSKLLRSPKTGPVGFRVNSSEGPPPNKTISIKGHVLHLRIEEQCPMQWLREQLEMRAGEIALRSKAVVLNRAYDSRGKVRAGYLGFGYYLPGEVAEKEPDLAADSASLAAIPPLSSSPSRMPAARPPPPAPLGLSAQSRLEMDDSPLHPFQPAAGRPGGLLSSAWSRFTSAPKPSPEVSSTMAPLPSPLASARPPLAAASSGSSPPLPPRSPTARSPSMSVIKPLVKALSPSIKPLAKALSPAVKPISKAQSPLLHPQGSSQDPSTSFKSQPTPDAVGATLHGRHPSDAIDNTDWNAMLTNVWSASIRRYYGSGDLIIELGSTHGCLFHILSGRAQCLDAQNQPMITLEAGEMLGEMSFLDVGTTGARSNVVAVGVVECQLLSQEALRTLIHFHPHLGARIYRGVSITSCLRYYHQRMLAGKGRSRRVMVPSAEGPD